MKGRDHFGRPRHRWDDNIKINFREIVYHLDSSGSEKGPEGGSFVCVCVYSYQPEGWLDPHTVPAPDAHIHTPMHTHIPAHAHAGTHS
jgi:hypothetical protein